MKRISLVLVLLLVLSATEIFAQTLYQGVVKPVDVKDYDLTYAGVSNTGSFGYSVLYRDNEDGGQASGGEGEGWGSHPGADILCPSGTQVRAISSGSVFLSTDDFSWGGLIIVKHEVTDIPGITEPVYSIYAHLKQRNITSGTVNKGDVIGLSGGGLGDPNAGNSTGAHLHFQIDRHIRLNDGQTVSHPYWPLDPNLGNDINTVNELDANHEVENATYNPMLFLQYRMITPVGFFDDGDQLYSFHTDGTSQAFVDAYNSLKSKGIDLGSPASFNGSSQYVHTKGTKQWLMQYFYKENSGRVHDYSLLVYNPVSGQCYAIHSGFWGHTVENELWNFFDPPSSNESGSNPAVQYFGPGSQTNKARMEWSEVGGFKEYDENGNIVNQYNLTFENYAGGGELDVYHHGEFITTTGQTIKRPANHYYADFKIAVDGGMDPVDAFTLNGDKIVYVNGDKTAEIISITGAPNPADLNETVEFQFNIKETSGTNTVTFPHIEILIDNGAFQNFYLQEIATDFSLDPGQTRTLTHSVSFSENDFPPDQYSVYLRWNDGQGNYFTMSSADGMDYPYHESVGQAGMPEVTVLAVTDPAYAGQDWHADFELTPQSGQTVTNDTIRIYYAEPGDINRVLWSEWYDVDIASGEIRHFTTVPESAPGVGTYEIKVYSVTNGTESLLPVQSGVSNPLTVYVQEQNPGSGKAETNCFYPTTNPIKDSPYEILIRIYETTNTSSVTLPEVRLSLYDTLGMVKSDLDTFYNVYLEPDGYFSHQEYYTFKDFGRQAIGLRYTYNGTTWDSLETFDSQFNITGPPNPYPIQVDTLVPPPPLPEGDWALLLRGEQNDCALITHNEQKGLNLTRDCSFEAWIKPFEYGGVIVSKFDDDIGAWKLYNFSVTNDGRLFFSYINDYAYKTELQTKDIVINLDKWQHVAACVDVSSASVHFYINGQPVVSQKLVGNSGGIKNDENVDFILGAYQKSNSSPNTSNHFTGLIDEVRIWNKLRSDVEVEQSYNNDLSGSEDGLVAYWKFDSTYVDFSQNENQLTPINGPSFVDTSFTKADYDTLMGYHLIRHDTITQTIDIDICDGAVYSFSSGWSGARSGANLSDASHNETEKWGEFKDNFFRMYHIYLLAHTEDLPDSAEVISARLGFYPEQIDIYDNNKYCYLSLVQAAPFDIYRLTNGDWPNFRMYNYTEKLRLENIAVAQINYFDFNSYGLARIYLTQPTPLGVRSGFDLEGSAPKKSNYILVAMADNSDVNKRPFLEVTYVITTKLQDTTSNGCNSILNHPTLSDGLVSYWDMEESSGSRMDKHNSNNLTENNSVMASPGIIGNAADFEYDNQEYFQIVDADQTGLDVVSGISISAWIKVESFATTMSIVTKGDTYDNSAYNFMIRKDGGLWMQIFDSPNNNISSYFFGGLDINNWYHVVATWSAGSANYIKLYVNGLEVSSYDGKTNGKSSIRNSSDPLWIGKREYNSSTSGFFDGLIDEVGIWDRELTSQEIVDLYNNGNGLPYNSQSLSKKSSTDDVVSFGKNIPAQYNLFQNYPNPFNPQTTIRYALPKDGNVRIVVYDILGRKVTELVNDYKSAGYYKLIWNASNVSSGVYIYQMTSGSFNSVKKMLLLR